MTRLYRISLVLKPQSEGGFTVTSPTLPGLVTEGDSLEEALSNVEDAFRATVEAYEDIGRPLPPEIIQNAEADQIEFDLLLPMP